jgi:hypothetical protein
LLEAIKLLDLKGRWVYSVYMIRNPWSISSFKGKWNPRDSRWTRSFRKQILTPFGVDPLTAHKDGIFFVDTSELSKIFTAYVIGHYRRDYQISWYD